MEKLSNRQGGEENERKDGEGGEKKADSPPYKAVRTEAYKYVEYDNGERELYDLQNDPYELDNFYESADPSLVKDLKTKLEALERCAGEECEEAEDAQ